MNIFSRLFKKQNTTGPDTSNKEWPPLSRSTELRRKLGLQESAGEQPPSIASLKKCAAEGQAEAQFNLGLMYYQGQGVPQDYAEAAKWYRLAAAEGQAEAQFNLGLMYYQGQGISQDYTEALKWFRLAAAQGHAKAQFNLSCMYYRGQGVPQDYAEALKWCCLAAAQGQAEAQFKLGVMYYRGQGVPQDYTEALKWFRLAAAQGQAEAQFNLSLMYYQGQGISQDYAEALKWCCLAAAQGDAEAQFNLGGMYYRGQGVPQDYAEALKWFRLAAAQGQAEAQFSLGLMYDQGQGVPQDYAEAAKWYRLAAAQGDAKAQSNLRVLYNRGRVEPTSSKPSAPQGGTLSRIEVLEQSLPAEARVKLTSLRTRLADMIITPSHMAEGELEDHNVARREVWGDRAGIVQVIRGTADEIFTALLSHLVADFRTGAVTDLHIKEVPAATDEEFEHVERARQQLSRRTDLSPLVKAEYEKAFIEHLRKQTKEGEVIGPSKVRKITLLVVFRSTAGPHDILRIEDNCYCLMPCSNERTKL